MRLKNVCFLYLISLFMITIISPAHAQELVIYDLKKWHNEKRFTASNRSTQLSETGICVDEREGEGIVWLKDVSFDIGQIEFDVKGKNVPGQSFVGLAFHGVDSLTYEAVYLRPFNFQSPDTVRRKHSVQYIAHPEFPWDKLREEHPEEYENSIEVPPNPNGWVHMLLMINKDTISVFINRSGTASLTVTTLNKTAGKMLGLWVGNNSGGEFANFRILM